MKCHIFHRLWSRWILWNKLDKSVSVLIFIIAVSPASHFFFLLLKWIKNNNIKKRIRNSAILGYKNCTNSILAAEMGFCNWHSSRVPVYLHLQCWFIGYERVIQCYFAWFWPKGTLLIKPITCKKIGDFIGVLVMKL